MYMKRAHLLLQTVERGHSDLVVVLAKAIHVFVVVVVVFALRKLGQNFDSDGVVVLVTAVCVSLRESARRWRVFFFERSRPFLLSQVVAVGI